MHTNVLIVGITDYAFNTIFITRLLRDYSSSYCIRQRNPPISLCTTIPSIDVSVFNIKTSNLVINFKVIDYKTTTISDIASFNIDTVFIVLEDIDNMQLFNQFITTIRSMYIYRIIISSDYLHKYYLPIRNFVPCRYIDHDQMNILSIIAKLHLNSSLTPGPIISRPCIDTIAVYVEAFKNCVPDPVSYLFHPPTSCYTDMIVKDIRDDYLVNTCDGIYKIHVITTPERERPALHVIVSNRHDTKDLSKDMCQTIPMLLCVITDRKCSTKNCKFECTSKRSIYVPSVCMNLAITTHIDTPTDVSRVLVTILSQFTNGYPVTLIPFVY